MATEAIEQLPNAETPAKTGGKSVMILAIVGLVAGGAAGVLILGPQLAKRKPPAAPHAAAPVIKAAPVVHAVENMVLNPAGSNGTRFLMVAATFEVKDAAAEALMKERDAEVRDVILTLLGNKAVDELTDMTRREAIKKEIVEAVSPLFPKGMVLRVYLPQFVVQ